MYMDVASYYINTTASSSHEIFCHLCEFGSIVSSEGNIPSWVPDWSTRRQQFLPDRAVKTRWGLCSDGYHQMHIHRGKEIRERAWRFFDSLLPASIPKFQREVHEWLESRNFFSVRSGASGQRLRVDWHPLAFFDRGGIIDQVLSPSTAPSFWGEVIAALESRNVDPYIKTYLAGEHSLLTLLAQIDGDEDDDADESRFAADCRIKDLRGLHALRDQLDSLSDHLRTVLNRISSSLSQLSIVRIEAMGGSYWAIGPPSSLMGDWVVPLMLPDEDRYVPMMCLRPISPTETERLLHQPSALTDNVLSRCRRFLCQTATESGCLHVTAKFVGPASHCDGGRLLDVSEHPSSSYKHSISEIMMLAHAAATSEGLPGPIVFDIV